MRQINLGLEKWWRTETTKHMCQVMKEIAKTTRKYRNATFDCNSDKNFTRFAVHLLKTLSPSLVDLRFLNAEIAEIHELYEFPKLELLRFKNTESVIDQLLLQGSTQLKELNLKYHFWADNVFVMKCLRYNKNLVMLKLWDSAIYRFFEIYEPNCFEFKLKRFAIGVDGTYSKEAEDNFLHFLDTQSDSLEAIRFRSGLDGVACTVMNKVFGMSAMRIIHLDSIEDVTGLNLVTNPRITELRLPWSIRTLHSLMPFLIAVPNVKVLYLRRVDKDILDYIARKMMALQTLFFSRADGCESCLKKIMSVHEDESKNVKLVCKQWIS